MRMCMCVFVYYLYHLFVCGDYVFALPCACFYEPNDLGCVGPESVTGFAVSV